MSIRPLWTSLVEWRRQRIPASVRGRPNTRFQGTVSEVHWLRTVSMVIRPPGKTFYTDSRSFPLTQGWCDSPNYSFSFPGSLCGQVCSISQQTSPWPLTRSALVPECWVFTSLKNLAESGWKYVQGWGSGPHVTWDETCYTVCILYQSEAINSDLINDRGWMLAHQSYVDKNPVTDTAWSQCLHRHRWLELNILMVTATLKREANDDILFPNSFRKKAASEWWNCSKQMILMEKEMSGFGQKERLTVESDSPVGKAATINFKDFLSYCTQNLEILKAIYYSQILQWLNCLQKDASKIFINND